MLLNSAPIRKPRGMQLIIVLRHVSHKALALTRMNTTYTKHRSNLFERHTPCIGKEKEYDRRHDASQDDKTEVQSPTNVLESDRCTLESDDAHEADTRNANVHAFGVLAANILFVSTPRYRSTFCSYMGRECPSGPDSTNQPSWLMLPWLVGHMVG
jgi:hypothetical protein